MTGFRKIGTGTARTALAAAAILGLTGCNDIPFASEPLPLDVAANQVPLPLVEQTARIAPAEGEADAIRLEDTTWVPTATEYALADAQVRPVGDAEGATVYAFAWDDAPFGRLLVRSGEGSYRELVAVRR